MEKKGLIAHITSNLKIFRAKRNLTQENIKNSIAISRQIYSMIECKKHLYETRKWDGK